LRDYAAKTELTEAFIRLANHYRYVEISFPRKTRRFSTRDWFRLLPLRTSGTLSGGCPEFS